MPEVSKARQVALYADDHTSVSGYSVFGDGVTDYSTDIQAAINFLWAGGGGRLYFPAGTYICEGLGWRDNVNLYAESLGSVILKLPNNSSSEIISNLDQSVPTQRVNVGAENIIFDGNKANADDSSAAASAVTCNGVAGFRSVNCIYQNATGYGLGLQARVGQSFSEDQDDIYLENNKYLNNGDGTSFSADTFDGIDVKDCNRLTMIGDVADGNADKGIDIRGEDVTIVGGSSINNGTTGYGLSGNSDGEDIRSSVALQGVHAHDNGADGVQLGSGAIVPVARVRYSLSDVFSHENGLRGISIPAVGSGLLEFTASGGNLHDNGSHGIQVLGDAEIAILDNVIIRDNNGSGVLTEIEGLQIGNCNIQLNNSYGVQENGAGQRTKISNTTLLGNGLGSFLGTNGRMTQGNCIDHALGSGNVIASTAELAITAFGDYYVVTGASDIDSILHPYQGRIVTLQFTGVLTVNNSSAIRLNGGANIITANRNMLTLVGDGTVWYQTSFSANV